MSDRPVGNGAILISKRVIAVAVSTFVAAMATPFASAIVTGQLAGCPCPNYAATNYSHPFRHLIWAAMLVAIALGMNRLRRAWPATGSMGRYLTAALLLSVASAAGQLVSGLWAVHFMHDPMLPPNHIFVPDTRPYLFIHDLGEFVALGSLFVLLIVSLLMLTSDSEDSKASR